tara:strand:+ start:1170 stop:1475 length:306 start_codon:yes stop_codon:yes gene_type:complete
MTIAKAIKKINVNAEFTYLSDDINSIKWLNGTTPIPKADIETKMNELQAEYNAEEWKRNRKAEYPSHEDCIHALLDGGDTLMNYKKKEQQLKINIQSQNDK